ncbi:MAG: AAA-like domain-containing protein [Sulfurovum sp.]
MSNNFYKAGGSLPANSKTYIKREADENLYNALKESKYCYVLNARQVGKSSLRVQISYRLSNDGYRCVNIDITNIGVNDITIETWYFSLVFAILEQLDLEEDEFLELWDSLERLTIINRFARLIDKILDSCPNNIVIFIDEIDSILGINIFSTDDFFAVIRTFYNMRSEDSKYNRLSFAIFGVARAEDLMRDSSRTPFNIAYSIKLNPLNRDESTPLLDGLTHQNIEANEILDKVFDYTDGTPYLTQKILEYISTNPIDKIIDELFIQNGFKETNISNIQNRIISDKNYNIKMLNLISKILSSQVISNDSDLAQIYLKLSGLVKSEDGYLVYNNEIYKMLFDKSWVEEQLSNVDRLFIQDLNRWLELDYDKSALLRGEVLKKAEKWTSNRDDLSIEENSYLIRV